MLSFFYADSYCRPEFVACFWIGCQCYFGAVSFSAFTLLVGHQKEHPTCKKTGCLPSCPVQAVLKKRPLNGCLSVVLFLLLLQCVVRRATACVCLYADKSNCSRNKKLPMCVNCGMNWDRSCCLCSTQLSRGLQLRVLPVTLRPPAPF